MATAISFDRTAAVTTTTVNDSLESSAVTFSNPSPNVTDAEYRLFLDNLTIDNTVVPAGPTWATDTITGSPGDFSQVREGDVISSATGWVSSQTVLSVAADGSTVTASAANDSAVNSGAEAITFTPGNIDSTLFFLKPSFSFKNNIVTVTVQVSVFDGNQVAEGSTADDSDDVTFSDGVQSTLGSFNINLDEFYSNARIART